MKKINDQKEEIQTLQTKILKAKQESDHLLIKKENEFKVRITRNLSIK